MSWEMMLLFQIAGTAATFCIVSWVIHLGIRYRRELPKLPVKESIAALTLQEQSIRLELDEARENLWESKQIIEESEKQRAWLTQNEDRVRDVGERLTELERVETTLAVAEESKATIDEQISGLLREKVEIETKLSLQADDLKRLEQLKVERTELEEAVPQLKSTLARLEDSIGITQQQKASAEKVFDELRKGTAEMQGVVIALSGERDALLEHLRALKSDVQSAGGVDQDADPCEDLWKPYFATERKSGGNSNELQRLERLHGELTDAGVQLPQRTLYALHTALKSQDTSPLTVLAGVSGTGKSLLPRMYAKAIGMYFLNLPIQPRWDSPQDLFGFYNYIEHKYKATDLARAMVQFNLYKWDTWSTGDAPSLDGQMLLVLLDEMNLARIEYYFSELLSRLEIRRDINPDDDDERAQVEIPLEIGHGHEGRDHVRIYPGGNVLFAGTMNEDESTQSLSDKVLDRASVLRFGKPQLTQSIQPDFSQFQEHDALTFDTWNVWKDDRNIAGAHTADEYIPKLNDLMEKVGNPFGHRISQSIANYVSLYPDRSHRGVNLAIADQIEQKILPKLRGLDLEVDRHHFTELINIVEKLDDHALLNELRQRTQSGTGAFLWRGLDRSEESE